MAATSSSGSDREWRFQEERRYQIPESWADNGRHEVADEGEEQFYAVQVKLGVELQWTVDGAGEPVDGPHRDRPVVQACYVSRDGSAAFVRDWDAVLDDGRATPERDFASVVAVDPADADPVEDDDNRQRYRDILQDRYDADPIVADGGQSSGETESLTLDNVDESTALRIYDGQFEGCIDVNAEEDPRPCLTFYVMTDFGIARLCSSYHDGFGNEGHRLAIPNRGEIPERCRESVGRQADSKSLELVDAEPLPSQREPHGEDPVTGLQIEVTGFGFDVKPWAERECARCGRPLDATSADQSPNGWLHEECNPSNWEDATLDGFVGGGA
ncbi:hypothetical protein [Halomicrobium katesii]|uniref:hypothetical protein n=1 Tax=Halomicrobium katesii TaxID=437163 RepID=UPI0012BAF817|nr:hypothetical protein [Halomicrobium katesii]